MRSLGAVMVLAAAVCFLPAEAADFSGDGTGDLAIFRPGSGLWAVRGTTRIYFGGNGDIPVPGDYDGSGSAAAGIYRPSSGLWAIRGVTRAYFGGAGDEPMPGDYTGDGIADIAIFRESSGLWAVKGGTRVYFGSSGDNPISPGLGSGVRGKRLSTGQTFSVQDGDDGYYQKGAAFSYQTQDPAGNGEIVTVDNLTGLMWASDGEGKGCSFGNTRTWSEAIDWAEGLDFAGYTDWRLPNIRELYSLLNLGGEMPAIDQVYFPNTRAGDYWSSTTYPDLFRQKALVGIFGPGTSPTQAKTGGYYVRAVRGG